MNDPIYGIHQSDIIIRSALVVAIADLRRNPYLLDSVFASLPLDTLTAAAYGEREVEQAKKWFLKTDIPVVLDYRMDDVEASCISISLVDSSETENTLGDVHYDPIEVVMSDAWPVLTTTFKAEKYVASTGVVTIPQSVADSLVIVPGMILVDATGHEYPVLSVQSRTSFSILPNSVIDLTQAVIKSQKPLKVQTLESLCFRETYRIGVHAHGEPFHLTWLHSIVVFALLRYKEELLEGRGFERSVMSSAPFAKNEALGRENYWSRFISLTGYVRQFWSKRQTDAIRGLESTISLVPGNSSGGGVAVPEDGYAEDSPWLLKDGIG